MSYRETLDYLYSQLPMFHRTGPAAYKADLVNTIRICSILDNHQDKFTSVHIAGTNGKGSTSHMLAAILQSAGYKTGLYTSPHLKDFRERVKINGEMIPETRVTEFVEKHRQHFDTIKPSFFEWTVGLAFDFFATEKVDIAIIETGLGGRLDSTNIIRPTLSVVTNIGYDHVSLLGDTLEKIAAEKAGIIKEGAPAVIGESRKETDPVFRKRAEEVHTSVFFADKLFKAENPRWANDLLRVDIKSGGFTLYRDLELDLTGIYQLKNILTVLQSVEELKRNRIPVKEPAIREGLRNVKKLTGLMGRWQIISKSPLTICDTGHNPEGIREVLKQIAQTPHKVLRFVIGMVSDKDINAVLTLLPPSAVYYFCRADIPRALPAEELKENAAAFGLAGRSFPSVKEAVKAAREDAGSEDLVFIGGSTFVVGEAL
jgi:dihydrofolate synthase / folylpolyglutamate synthase